MANKTFAHLQHYITQKDKILDVGSGNGFISEKIRKEIGARVIPIDVGNFSENGHKPIIFDGVSIPFHDNTFSTSIVCFVLHHARHPLKLLQEIKRVTIEKIIIFEDTPETLLDIVLTYGHWIGSLIKYRSRKMQFKPDAEWKKIFNTLGFVVVEERYISRKRHWIYPIHRKMYLLQPVKA